MTTPPDFDIRLVGADHPDDEQTFDQMVEDAGVMAFAGGEAAVRFQQFGGEKRHSHASSLGGQPGSDNR